MRPLVDISNERGVAMVFAMMMLVLFALSALFAVDAGFQQRKVTETVVGSRVRNYYRAQAGLVDARERIYRDDTASAPALTPAGSFTDPNYNPDEYQLNIDGQGGNDVEIDIGPEDGATKLRTIVCTSIGN